MSVYQYYEFQALDRRLTDADMKELGGYSSRARITPSSFTNEYNWGDFKGNANDWMETYFDVFLYLANWGTRTLQIRLPATLLSIETADPYCAGDAAGFRERGGSLIFTFHTEEEESGWEEGEGVLGGILPIRDELARGDLRALYLGWLLGFEQGELDDDEEEPPVPPGLGNLSPALACFAEFFRIDQDLPGNYDLAIQHLMDLRDLAARRGAEEAFVETLASLRQMHARKPSFLKRLESVDGVTEDLVATTRRVMADATAFDEKHRNHNFQYDWEAYRTVEDNFRRLLDAGRLADVMALASELMGKGSLQVEASDEGMMMEELERCLRVAINAVEGSGLPAADIVQWANRMMSSDRLRFICEKELGALRSRFQTG